MIQRSARPGNCRRLVLRQGQFRSLSHVRSVPESAAIRSIVPMSGRLAKSNIGPVSTGNLRISPPLGGQSL